MADRPLDADAPKPIGPRLVVVQPEDAPGQRRWLPVGVLPWRTARRHLAIALKATFTWAPASDELRPEVVTARLAAQQEPLTPGAPSGLPVAGPDELAYPSDFVPKKAAPDVLVVGHAVAATPVQRVQGVIAVAGLRRVFVASAAAPARAIPLSRAYRRAAAPLGPPLGPPRQVAFDPEHSHDDAFDYGAYNAAAALQRPRAIPPDATIELVGLTPDARRRVVALPGLAPVVTVDARGWRERSVEMVCDTLWLDVDREIAVVVWRGSVEVNGDGGEVERITASLEHAERPRTPAARASAMQRGGFGFALCRGDAPERVAAEDEDERTRLQMARYATWGADAPEPRLTLAEYAGIAAELAEWPDARGKTLARHELDEDAWTIEERAWLEKMGNAALEGDATLPEAYSRDFVEAQDALATDAERAQTLAEYAEVKAVMDEADDPTAALGALELTLPRWLRMDRRWTAAAERDPPVARDLEARLAAIRAASEAKA